MFDIDGTISEDGTYISDKLLLEMNKLKKLGHIICFATGRGICETKKILNGFKPNFPVVLSNGQVVYDITTEKILFSVRFDSNVSEHIKRNTYNYEFRFYEIDGMYYANNTLNALLCSLIVKTERNDVVICENKFPDISISKMFFKSKDHDKWITEVSEAINLSFLNNNWKMICPLQTNKMVGINFLLSKMCINKNSVIFFGNDFNDIEALRFFPNSFSIGKIDLVRKSSAFHVDSIADLQLYLRKLRYKLSVTKN